MKEKILQIIKDSAKILAVVIIVCLVYKLDPLGIAVCLLAAIAFNFFFQK